VGETLGFLSPSGAQPKPGVATFHVSYDAAAQRWSGTLTVAGLVYAGSRKTLFTLLRHVPQTG